MTMTNPSSSTTISPSDLRSSLDLIEVKPGYRFSLAVLRDILPDVETLLFFGKVYELDYHQLSKLMSDVLQSDLAIELFHGTHSTDLQDYLIDITDVIPSVEAGDIVFNPSTPQGEILPELWKSLEVEVAASIKEVADKLRNTIGLMPGKQGQMVFQQLAKINLKRPTIGDYRAGIHHAPTKDNLVILDVSGSMTEGTIRNIIDDVVSLSYMANAHLAIVSNTTTVWTPGSFDTDAVLRRSEFGGTHYETLTDLLQGEWGVVVTIADYDSSMSAKTHLAQRCTVQIDKVLDISLVNQPTFLAECVGQFAQEVQPLLIASSYYPLAS